MDMAKRNSKRSRGEVVFAKLADAKNTLCMARILIARKSRILKKSIYYKQKVGISLKEEGRHRAILEF